MYGLEIILFVTLPLIVYGIVKALTNPDFNWDSVLQITTYIWHKPDLMSLSAATFSFSGYINLAIFNRVFHGLKLKHVWILGVEGLLVLLITFWSLSVISVLLRLRDMYIRGSRRQTVSG